MAAALVGSALGAVPLGLAKRSDTHPLRFFYGRYLVSAGD